MNKVHSYCRERSGTTWETINGYEGLYEVSESGLVRSIPRDYGFGVIEKPTLIKPSIDEHGYLRVTLSKDGGKRHHLVHRLVAEAFVSNPLKKSFVNHIDRCITNNHMSNLEWVTPSENTNHENCKTLISAAVSREIEQIDPVSGMVVRVWPSLKSVREETGWDASCISECCNGKRKTSHGYKWRKVRSNGSSMER